MKLECECPQGFVIALTFILHQRFKLLLQTITEIKKLQIIILHVNVGTHRGLFCNSAAHMTTGGISTLDIELLRRHNQSRCVVS